MNKHPKKGKAPGFWRGVPDGKRLTGKEYWAIRKWINDTSAIKQPTIRLRHWPIGLTTEDPLEKPEDKESGL